MSCCKSPGFGTKTSGIVWPVSGPRANNSRAFWSCMSGRYCGGAWVHAQLIHVLGPSLATAESQQNEGSVWNKVTFIPNKRSSCLCTSGCSVPRNASSLACLACPSLHKLLFCQVATRAKPRARPPVRSASAERTAEDDCFIQIVAGTSDRHFYGDGRLEVDCRILTPCAHDL